MLTGPLMLELIPESCWGQNLRKVISKQEWDLLRQKIYEETNFGCAICRRKGRKHPVECHEQWQYVLLPAENGKEVRRGKQILVGLQALCPLCHAVKHFGTKKRDREEKLAHLMGVNGWDNLDLVEAYLAHEFQINRERSRYSWDLEYLEYWQYRRNRIVTPTMEASFNCLGVA